MKKLILLLIAMLCTMTMVAQKYYGRVYDRDGYTNIRRGPSTNTGIVRKYYSGDYLYYIPQSNGWSKVYSGERNDTYMGYMHTSRIVRVNPNGGSSSSSSNLYSGYITDPKDNYVNVRRGPGVKHPIATQLTVGTFVYYSTSGAWRKVYNSNKRFLGYIYYDRVR